MTTDMNIEQERAAFEAWAKGHYILQRSAYNDTYIAVPTIRAWEVWQARAALQSQDREDVVDRDVVAKQLRDMASSAYQTAMAFGVSQDNFERLAYQVFDNNSRILDHARRIEGGET